MRKPPSVVVLLEVVLLVSMPTLAQDTSEPDCLPQGACGIGYHRAVPADGGIDPYVYAVAGGAIPAGLSLSSDGCLSGEPRASGTFTFTVAATDLFGTTYSRSYVLEVLPREDSVGDLATCAAEAGAMAGRSTVITGDDLLGGLCEVSAGAEDAEGAGAASVSGTWGGECIVIALASAAALGDRVRAYAGAVENALTAWPGPGQFDLVHNPLSLPYRMRISIVAADLTLPSDISAEAVALSPQLLASVDSGPKWLEGIPRQPLEEGLP
jgi:hypothetical protein